MKRYLLLCVLCLAALASACGYSFRGSQNNLPSDIYTISIPVFKNLTGEERIESIFTDRVIFEFTRSQMLTVASRGKADATLRCTIVSAAIADVALSGQETSSQRRITIGVDGELVRNRDGKVLWKGKNIQQRRTYFVAGSAQGTESNKRQAITELAKQMAETIHDSVFENF